MAPWTCRPTRAARLAALAAWIFAAETERRVGSTAAPKTSGRAKSSAIRTSASWCLIAWYEPMARPNWVRCFTYVTESASTRSPAPSSSAAVARTARSKAASRSPCSTGAPAVTSNRWRLGSTDVDGVAGGRAVQLTVDEHEDVVRDVGVEGVRHRDRCARLGEVDIGQRDREVRRGLDPGAGHDVTTDRLEPDGHLDGRGLGGERRHADLGQPRPELEAGLVVTSSPGPVHGRRCRPGTAGRRGTGRTRSARRSARTSSGPGKV